MVDRRIVFYRWQSANAQVPFIPHESAHLLADAIAADESASILVRSDSTTAIRVLDPGRENVPSRIQLLAVRNKDDLPVEWSPGQTIRSLVMADGYSTADVTHFLIWPDGFVAQDWHNFAPRPSRLAQMLRVKAGAHASINVLYRPDMLASLMRLRGHLRSVELAITSPELVDVERPGMMATLFPAAFGHRAPSLSLRLSMGRFGPRDRYIDSQTEEAVFQIAEQAQELVDSMTVSGVDPDTGRKLSVNLLKERIGQEVSVEPSPDAENIPHEQFVFDEMLDVRRDLDDQGLLQAAVDLDHSR